MLLRALALGSTIYSVCAGAQLTATLSVVSDYRFRGVSLSQQKPAVQAHVGYDDPSGWFGGVFGSTVRLPGESATTGQAVAYIGAVTPIGVGFNWEVGADYSAFSEGRDYDYGEVFTGITSQNFKARLHYSPNYFGFARGSFYGELTGTHPLGSGFALVGHVGVLMPVGQTDNQYTSATRNPLDARVGLAVTIAGLDIQVAWVGTNGTGSLYPVYGTQRRNTVVASVSRSF